MKKECFIGPSRLNSLDAIIHSIAQDFVVGTIGDWWRLFEELATVIL